MTEQSTMAEDAVGLDPAAGGSTGPVGGRGGSADGRDEGDGPNRAATPPSEQLAARLAALAHRTPVRRDNGRAVPLGKKASRTYAALTDAAFELFCDQGYQATSVSAIAERAGVSLAAFYQYFLDRADVVAALVSREVATVLESGRQHWDADGGAEGLRPVVQEYVRRYVETVRFQAVWEDATHAEPALAVLRRDLTRLYTSNLEHELALAAAAGAARSDLDAGRLARAVTAMVDRYCYMTYVLDPGDPPDTVEQTAEVLVGMAVPALGLR